MARAAFFGSGILDESGELSRSMGFASSLRKQRGMYELKLTKAAAPGAQVRTFVFRPQGVTAGGTVDGDTVTVTTSPGLDARTFVLVLGPETISPRKAPAVPSQPAPAQKEG